MLTVAGCFGLSDQYLTMTGLRGTSRVAFERYAWGKELDRGLRFKKSVALGWFFQFAPEKAVEWIIRHYVAYLLSLNFATALWAFGLLAWKTRLLGQVGWAWYVVPVTVSVYCLFALSCTRYLTAYQGIYRTALADLAKEWHRDQKKKKKKLDPFPTPTPDLSGPGPLPELGSVLGWVKLTSEGLQALSVATLSLVIAGSVAGSSGYSSCSIRPPAPFRP